MVFRTIKSIAATSAILAALTACGGKHVGDEPSVRSISFVEQEQSLRWARGTSDFHLRTAVNQQESPFGAYTFWWIDREYLDRDGLMDDAERLEVWYAHHGFLDARFVGWEVNEVGGVGEGPVEAVDLVGHIAEGEPSEVRSVTIEGLDRLAVLKDRFQRGIVPPVGERFDLATFELAREEMEAKLWGRSFAYAEVIGSVDAWPEEHAVDLTYRVQGVTDACRFGEVEVVGLEGVPEDVVMSEVTVERGKPFNPARLAETQAGLFSLGAFSMVRVTPVLRDGHPVIPVRIELSPAATRELKVGAGVGVEAGEQQLRSSTRFSNTNLLGKLWRLEMEGEAGYKSFAQLQGFTFDSLTGLGSGLFAAANAELSVPLIFGPDWLFRQEGEVERGVEQASSFFRWLARPSLARSFGNRLTLTAGWRLERWLGDFNELLVEPGEESFGDFSIYGLETSALWDSRDDPISPRRGDRIEVTLSDAGLLGGYSFARGSADIRHYRPVRSIRGVLSWRLFGGVALPQPLPIGSDELVAVPYPERFWLGGGTTVRGWAVDHLGPLVCSDESEECIGLGGEAALSANLQLLLPIPYDFQLALFGDAGMVWPEVGDVELSELQPSVGLGLRYATPVGPLRIDVARRLIENPYFASEPMTALHLGISEAF